MTQPLPDASAVAPDNLPPPRHDDVSSLHFDVNILGVKVLDVHLDAVPPVLKAQNVQPHLTTSEFLGNSALASCVAVPFLITTRTRPPRIYLRPNS